MEFVKKDKQGSFWMERNSKVIWKGSIHHKDAIDRKNPNGDRIDEDKYYSVIKTEFKGEAKYEILQSIGLLYLKSGNANPNAPDMSGPVTVDLGQGKTVQQKFAGWLNDRVYKDANTGEEIKTKVLNVNFSEPLKKETDDDVFPPVTTAFDDDAPF